MPKVWLQPLQEFRSPSCVELVGDHVHEGFWFYQPVLAQLVEVQVKTKFV